MVGLRLSNHTSQLQKNFDINWIERKEVAYAYKWSYLNFAEGQMNPSRNCRSLLLHIWFRYTINIAVTGHFLQKFW